MNVHHIPNQSEIDPGSLERVLRHLILNRLLQILELSSYTDSFIKNSFKSFKFIYDQA